MIHLDELSDNLRTDDGDREYYYHLGVILAKMHKTEKAIKALDAALLDQVDFDDYENALDLKRQLTRDENSLSRTPVSTKMLRFFQVSIFLCSISLFPVDFIICLPA